MSGQPTVSVIIAVYNAAAYLRACLESVAAQTLADIEIICVDDGSTDASADIIRELAAADERIVLISQDNRFAGVARNNGLDHASGEYVLFLDADDFFEADMLAAAVERIREYDADICVFDSDFYDQREGVFRNYGWAFRREFFADEPVFNPAEAPNNENIFRMFNGWAWDKLMRRQFVVEQGLRFQDLRSTNDLLFVFLALACAARITTLDRKLAHQRVNIATSISRTRAKSWDNFYLALQALDAELRERGLKERYDRAFANWVANFSLWQLDTMPDEEFALTYNLLREQAFPQFGLDAAAPEQFFSAKEHARVRGILQDPLIPELPAGEAAGPRVVLPVSPAVSVIVPTLNARETIRFCLASLTGQTLRDIEIICVDAGSVDGTVRQLKELASRDARISVITGERRSFGHLLNVGIAHARGEYVAVVEAEDYLASAALATLVPLARSFDADAVFANCFRPTPEGEMFSEVLADLAYGKVLAPQDSLELFAVQDVIGCGLYRRNLLEDNRITAFEGPGLSYGYLGFMCKAKMCAARVLAVKHPFYHCRTDAKRALVDTTLHRFGVCDEFADVEEFLAERPDLGERFEEAVAVRRMVEYHRNYLRLAVPYRYEFAERVSLAFAADEVTGMLDDPAVPEEVRAFGRAVVFEPESLVEKTDVSLARQIRDGIKDTGTGEAMLVPYLRAKRFLGRVRSRGTTGT